VPGGADVAVVTIGYEEKVIGDGSSWVVKPLGDRGVAPTAAAWPRTGGPGSRYAVRCPELAGPLAVGPTRYALVDGENAERAPGPAGGYPFADAIRASQPPGATLRVAPISASGGAS
jgi:hypothetical protein